MRSTRERVRLEAAMAEREEAALLQFAREEFWRSLAEQATAASELLDPARLVPAASPQRVVVQNWKGAADVIPIGDVRLQLEPGQEVTLWLDRTPSFEVDRSDELVDGLTILMDDDVLVG